MAENNSVSSLIIATYLFGTVTNAKSEFWSVEESSESLRA